MNAYINRGIVKLDLNTIDESEADLQTALELSEHQEDNNLKASIEERLQELNNFTLQDSETKLTLI